MKSDRLTAAIVSGGELQGLLEAVKACGERRLTLEAEREALRAQRAASRRLGHNDSTNAGVSLSP